MLLDLLVAAEARAPAPVQPFVETIFQAYLSTGLTQTFVGTAPVVTPRIIVFATDSAPAATLLSPGLTQLPSSVLPPPVSPAPSVQTLESLPQHFLATGTTYIFCARVAAPVLQPQHVLAQQSDGEEAFLAAGSSTVRTVCPPAPVLITLPVVAVQETTQSASAGEVHWFSATATAAPAGTIAIIPLAWGAFPWGGMWQLPVLPPPPPPPPRPTFFPVFGDDWRKKKRRLLEMEEEEILLAAAAYHLG